MHSLYNWLDRWIRRHALHSFRIHGEAGSANKVAYYAWLTETFSSLVKQKSIPLEDIWNADETGIFYKQLPRTTLTNQGPSSGWTHPKNRLSGLFAASMTGSKRRPFIVGSNQQLGKRIYDSFDYNYNKNSWMTTELFNMWLEQWDNELIAIHKQIHLIIDNCSTHKQTYKPRNITLLYLPAHCTSIGQPLDQGVLHALKAGYRELLLSHIVSNRKVDANYRMAFKTYINIIVEAWHDIEPSIIINCFKKAGWIKSSSCTKNSKEQESAESPLQAPDPLSILEQAYAVEPFSAHQIDNVSPPACEAISSEESQTTSDVVDKEAILKWPHMMEATEKLLELASTWADETKRLRFQADLREVQRTIKVNRVTNLVQPTLMSFKRE